MTNEGRGTPRRLAAHAMLRALELNGFKSFADKTRLEFPPGVTCVVGPNGSGKSNVVDALKWVLGAQSAKALRGQEMADVIFSGASGRRPMNFAEVTLELDNSAGMLEVASERVRLTRRVYRSGEGEYLINGAPSRLKDFRTLLAGTGAGADAYSIIEQGRVDAVLNSSPKDRRALFEEAAGVSRFRIKKQEADRRLARVEQNLLRLSDIVDEVEGRLRRVRRQAGRAQQYRDQTERLRALRTELGLADWLTMEEKGRRLEEQVARLTAQSESGAAALGDAEEELARLDTEASAAATRLTQADRRLADLREQMGAARATAASQAARVEELEEELRHKLNQMVGAMTRPDESCGAPESGLTEQLAEADRQLSAARDALVETEEAVLVAHAEAQRLKEELDHAHAQQQEMRAAAREHELRRQQLEATLSDLRRRCEQLKIEARASADQRDRLGRQAEEAQRRARDTAEALRESGAALADAQRRTADGRVRLRDAQKRIAATEAHAVSVRHQLATVEELESGLEALREGVGPARDAQGATHWSVLGIVADLLHVDYDSAPMVEAALGERAHHLVVDSGRALLEALGSGERLTETRTSFQRLDCAPPASVADRIDLTGQPGVMGRADQFVECDAAFGPLVKRMLGRVWFVDSLATAQRLADGPGRGLGFVTYAGETLTAEGGLTVGPKDQARSLLTRKARREDLRADLAEADRSIEQLRGTIASLESDVDESVATEQAELARRTQATDANAEARHAAERLRERLSAAEKELASQTEALDGASKETERLLGLAAAANKDLADTGEQLERLSDVAQELAHRHAKAAARVAELRETLVERQVTLARAEQRAEILRAQRQETARSAAERDRSRHAADEHGRACRARMAERQRQWLGALGALNELHLEADALMHTRRAADRAARGAHQRKAELSAAVKRRRATVGQAGGEREQLTIQLTQVRHQQAALADRLRDDYGIDLAHAAKSAADLRAEVENRAAIEREIAELRSDINTVGAVNLESIEELDDLEARFDELSGQFRDLSDAKASLERLTQRINAETRKLFLATVEEVRGHFHELFRQLFGGGEADLMLVDAAGDDPLDAGVEIAASPPGKELRSISLLSGGEKTLTCVALLLALFRSKPSPFCVLDEVDAALDEANIGRFTGVLSEFLSSTQFIVITHSKKTMTGADTMYGVTMQESGVSKQVAVRFEDVGEDGHINPRGVVARGEGDGQAPRAA